MTNRPGETSAERKTSVLTDPHIILNMMEYETAVARLYKTKKARERHRGFAYGYWLALSDYCC